MKSITSWPWMWKRLHDGVNHHLRTVLKGRFASYCRPTSIIFLLTERCNARCVHCDIWKNKGREDSPSVEQWKMVLSDLRRWLGPVQVVFSGGEALLKPFTVDLVAFSSSIGLFQEVLSHGLWQDQSRIEQLAMAKPWQVTVSFDGFGGVHDKIRGRENFFEHTLASIRTLQRVRTERNLSYHIQLKTVLMSHNLEEAGKIAEFASQPGMNVFYQAIEQNYNTTEDARWFEQSENWPKDTDRAAAVVDELIGLKRKGLHIANSDAQLQAMIAYFGNPWAQRMSIQAHTAHEKRAMCGALTTLQIQSNGDVTICAGKAPVGNIKTGPIRSIWENRPRFWENGCCLEERLIETEEQVRSLAAPAR